MGVPGSCDCLVVLRAPQCARGLSTQVPLGPWFPSNRGGELFARIHDGEDPGHASGRHVGGCDDGSYGQSSGVLRVEHGFSGSLLIDTTFIISHAFLGIPSTSLVTRLLTQIGSGRSGCQPTLRSELARSDLTGLDRRIPRMMSPKGAAKKLLKNTTMDDSQLCKLWFTAVCFIAGAV